MTIEPVARIRTDFTDKFGIPRQSGRVPALQGRIVFEPSFRNPDALREIEGFSHLWLIFDFSQSHRDGWSATVRPPRLGGNRRIGVFASRSPFRPNPLGLSCVRLERIEETDDGMELIVSGVDLLDGTPIYDIKPYIPYADCIPQASGGYTESTFRYRLEVDFPAHMLDLLPEDKRDAVIGCLAEDPRPSYQDDPQRIYSMRFMDYDVRFRVRDGVLTVTEVEVYRTSS
ncbi:MAG: tRNA (N6-threonylcarbamoyladenosine(37)-N6)-methyltransferase TrmO [Clostridia bacterium]|nr:tRNA (N6-threonylcarbamoyladenosine(37)-N6)-methyltransferase TrmO [Clostridia bacterium]